MTTEQSLPLSQRQITINANVLRALLEFAGKCCFRDEMNCVCLQITDTSMRAYATNGHFLGVYTEDNFDVNAERHSVLLNASDLKFLMKKRLKKLKEITVDTSINKPDDIIKSALVGTKTDLKSKWGLAGLCTLKPVGIDEMISKRKKTIDDNNAFSIVSFDADYLLSMHKVNRILAGHDFSDAEYRPPTINAYQHRVACEIQFPRHENFKAYIMPLHHNASEQAIQEAAFICPTQVLKTQYTYHAAQYGHAEWFDTAGDALRAYKAQCDANGSAYHAIKINAKTFTEPYTYMPSATVSMLPTQPE